MRLLRLIKIFHVILRFGLDEFIFGHERVRVIRVTLRSVLFWRNLDRSRGERLRLALESLGPIFVKFGQVLSTRRDLLPQDIADELAKLQDQVPPFPSSIALAILAELYRCPIHEVFDEFNPIAVASASVAQVHFAKLKNGTEIAVKILRPNIAQIISKDIALLNIAAGFAETVWSEGKRFKPREIVAEFEKHLADELDLMREAANANQLRRNFENSPLLKVPEIYWDYCSSQVMVMERMVGTPISQVETLRAQGIDIPALARAGVEIFFTQVFRDGFFHADMHPGNIFVASTGQYVALDFGIMGTLNDEDKNYLAQNFLAFFQRDYKRVAEVHLESGWVAKETRIDELESAIRSVCEPIFDKPLKEISFGKVLLRLFQVSRRFHIEIQPQLVLLQKTLLNIEGLGRQLDPDLDLWKTAKPFLEHWMSEQVGWRGLMRHVRQEAPYWGALIPQLPRLIHQTLSQNKIREIESDLFRLYLSQKRQNSLLGLIVLLLIVILSWMVLR